MEIDLLKHLTAMETGTGTALRLMFTDGTPLYQSPNWPSASALDRMLIAEYPLNAYTASKTYLVAAIAKDEQVFYAKLAETNYWVLTAAAGLTLLSVLIALMLLEKTAINPLRLLTQQLRDIWQDEGQLGERVTVSGNAEVVELAKGFNEMTTKLEKLYENLEHMAFTDPLTQLPNRILFGTQLEAALARARRSGRNLALLFLDLDRFKIINDTLGHGVGDELLRGVSNRLRQCIRETDMVARLGGDEFVILLDLLESGQAAEQVAQKILREFTASFNINGQELFISVSIGISTFPDDGDDIQTLFKCADSAMYTAKASGRNTYYFFSSADQDVQAVDRLQLSNDLRHAIARDEIYLLYQPRFNLKTGAVQGMEALARWRHPTRGIIPPAIFIALAEQSGQMEEIGAWVLRAACRQLRDWGDAHVIRRRVAVNLSALQFNRSDLPLQIAAILDEYSIDPGLLELEITESVVMTDAQRAIQVLTELSARGLLIAIDDFGTGYSSLSYLKRFPVSYLKIDKSFVAGVCKNPDDAAITRAIIAMAKNLGLQLIAEGVESEDQRAFLASEDCDEAQGFFFSHPLPPSAVAALLEKKNRGVTNL